MKDGIGVTGLLSQAQFFFALERWARHSRGGLLSPLPGLLSAQGLIPGAPFLSAFSDSSRLNDTS